MKVVRRMGNRIFGEKVAGVEYQKRKGVYAVIFHTTKSEVAVVQTRRGHYFLPGGGIEGNETNEECLKRELLEETGYEIKIGSLIGKALNYFYSTMNEPICSEGYFYMAEFLHKTGYPVEDDHCLRWLHVEKVEQLLIHEHHQWAMKERLKNEFS
jgi:8-oxo-dGTP diphosphatase